MTFQASWDTLNESMTNTTNGNGPGSVGNSNQDFENQNTSNSNDNNPSNPGYRPWEAEVASNHAMSTSQVTVIKAKVTKVKVVKVMDDMKLAKRTMVTTNILRVRRERCTHPPTMLFILTPWSTIITTIILCRYVKKDDVAMMLKTMEMTLAGSSSFLPVTVQLQ